MPPLPVIPPKPKLLTGWDKFANNFLGLFGLESKAQKKYYADMRERFQVLKEYDQVDKVREKMNETYQKESPFVKFYREASPYAVHKDANEIDTSQKLVSYIQVLKDVSEKWKQIPIKEKEVEAAKKYVKNLPKKHDETWKQMVEVIAENACARRDAMRDGTYERSAFSLETVAKKMQNPTGQQKEPQNIEAQKAPERIEPVKTEVRKSSGPQLG